MTLTRLVSTERISQANPRETTRKRFRLNTNDPVHSPRLEPRQTTTLDCTEGTSFTTMPLTTGRDIKSNPENSNKGITVGNDLTNGFSENPSKSHLLKGDRMSCACKLLSEPGGERTATPSEDQQLTVEILHRKSTKANLCTSNESRLTQVRTDFKNQFLSQIASRRFTFDETRLTE